MAPTEEPTTLPSRANINEMHTAIALRIIVGKEESEQNENEMIPLAEIIHCKWQCPRLPCLRRIDFNRGRVYNVCSDAAHHQRYEHGHLHNRDVDPHARDAARAAHKQCKNCRHHREFVSEARHKEKKNRNSGKIVTEICNKCFQTQPVSFF